MKRILLALTIGVITATAGAQDEAMDEIISLAEQQKGHNAQTAATIADLEQQLADCLELCAEQQAEIEWLRSQLEIEEPPSLGIFNDAVPEQVLIDHVIGGADQRIATPPRFEMELEMVQHLRRQRQRLQPHDLREQIDRRVVAFLDNVVVELGFGFLLRVAMHDIAVPPNLQLATIFLARELAVGVDLGLAIREIVGGEHRFDKISDGVVLEVR